MLLHQPMNSGLEIMPQRLDVLGLSHEALHTLLKIPFGAYYNQVGDACVTGEPHGPPVTHIFVNFA